MQNANDNRLMATTWLPNIASKLWEPEWRSNAISTLALCAESIQKGRVQLLQQLATGPWFPFLYSSLAARGRHAVAADGAVGALRCPRGAVGAAAAATAGRRRLLLQCAGVCVC